jgi:hypothetical protein
MLTIVPAKRPRRGRAPEPNDAGATNRQKSEEQGMADVIHGRGCTCCPQASSLPRPAAPVARLRSSANPVGARIAEERPTEFARARTANREPEPTLFPSGDLPPFTASGIDPSVLLQVPWQARVALAGAGTLAEAYKLLNDYGGPEGEERAEVEFGYIENELVDRYYAWLLSGIPDDELADAVEAMSNLGRVESKVISSTPFRDPNQGWAF